MRVILYTGKGGVGKTSMAAASALKIAESGKKVLVMSTDQAHSLGDSFDKKLGKEPVSVTDHLDALEIDAAYESEKAWGSMKSYFRSLLTLKNEDSIEVEELLVFPGLEELFSMMKILDFYEEGYYDVLVVDCAPTGETLSLLQYPEKLSNVIEKVLPMKRKTLKVAGPVIGKVTKIPMPKDSIFDDVEVLMQRMEKLQNLMLNKKEVSVRIVTTPEQIVIREAKRNFTFLHLFNYNIDALFVNKVYPQEAMEGYFNKWIEMQQKGLDEISQCFSEIPKFYVNLQKSEVRTIEVLKNLSEQIFAEVDPSKVLFEQDIYQIEKDNEHYRLKIYLPFATKSELELRQVEQELVISVKNEVRRFPLMNELSRKDIVKAKLENDFLMVEFA